MVARLGQRGLRTLAAARRCDSTKPQHYDLRRLMKAHPPLRPHVVPRQALLEAKKGKKGKKVERTSLKTMAAAATAAALGSEGKSEDDLTVDLTVDFG